MSMSPEVTQNEGLGVGSQGQRQLAQGPGAPEQPAWIQPTWVPTKGVFALVSTWACQIGISHSKLNWESKTNEICGFLPPQSATPHRFGKAPEGICHTRLSASSCVTLCLHPLGVPPRGQTTWTSAGRCQDPLIRDPALAALTILGK